MGAEVRPIPLLPIQLHRFYPLQLKFPNTRALLLSYFVVGPQTFWDKSVLIVPTVKESFPWGSTEILVSDKEEQTENQLLVSEHSQNSDRRGAEVVEKGKTIPQAPSELADCVGSRGQRPFCFCHTRTR